MWLVGFLIQLQAKHFIPDSALNLLLRFLHTFFCVLGRFCGFVAAMATQFPSTLYRLKKTLTYAHQFTRFVVCPKCLKLYHYEECVVISGSRRSSKVCSHCRYPNHPYCSCRRECGHRLLKSVLLVSGRNLLYPLKCTATKVYSQASRSYFFAQAFMRAVRTGSPGMFQISSLMCMMVNMERLFNCLRSTISCSSFQSGIDAQYRLVSALQTVSSIGAIYLTIMNLPRTMRFKRKNAILVGKIPGPSEPTHDINTLLYPLVNELTSFWTGITMEVHEGTTVLKEDIRCALLCCACDLQESVWLSWALSFAWLLKVFEVIPRYCWKHEL